MQARNLSGNYFNDPKFQIQPSKAQSVVIDFLKYNLSLYLSQYDKNLTGEDDISQAIFIFLETQARQNNSDFLFCFQYKYISSRRSVDIAVVHEGSFKAFFVIEAKRLRSEEHTSELQSHSFISYAVFCLKKKKKK